MTYTISTDKTKLDVPLIHDYLSNHSYWAKGRTLKQVEMTIETCVCFGAYQGEEQVGFARVLTDFVRVHLYDVFVLEQHRGQGLGKQLLEAALSYPGLERLDWFLATLDAHDFYRQYGFEISENTGRRMHRPRQPP